MKAPVLILAKLFSILLIVALLAIQTKLVQSIFFNYRYVSQTVFVVAFWALIALGSYFFTIRYSNKIITEEILAYSKIKVAVFIVFAIISFGFSIFLLVVIVADILDNGFSSIKRMILDNRKVIDIA